MMEAAAYHFHVKTGSINSAINLLTGAGIKVLASTSDTMAVNDYDAQKAREILNRNRVAYESVELEISSRAEELISGFHRTREGENR